MRLPSKVTPYKASILAKMPIILKTLEVRDMRPEELFQKVKGRGINPADFIEIMDCLFILGKVEFLPGTEVLHYAARDQV